ncbi:MAG: hypothetical protein GYA26_11640 [Flexilinea flocculi]|jgi:hypothetical protein|nr:hypothetical protein [Flexilinea flocculi]
MGNNQKKTTLWIVVIAAILLIGCMCLSACAAGLFIFLKAEPQSMLENIFNNADDDNKQNSADQTEEPEQDTSFNTLTPGQMKIIETAQKIRELSTQNDFSPVYKTKEDLRKTLIEQLHKNTSKQDLVDEHDLLTILGFIPQDFDLEKFYLDFYAEQIAGFYDHESGEMILVKDGTEKENSLTLAHEFIHYLQFDNFDMEGKLNYNKQSCETDSEYCLSLEAVMEGDATLMETLLTRQKDLDLQKDEIDESVSKNFENAPKYFQEYLMFPYSYGFNFVYSFYIKDGFPAVDRLYSNPPVSIEQIMHPDRYPDEKPTPILMEPFQDEIAKGCELIFDNTLNEADLLWLLNSGYEEKWRLSDKTAQEAADGWGGGHFQFARCDEKPMFFSKTTWDSKKDADEFTKALSDYNQLRWNPGDADATWTGNNNETIDVIQQEDVVYFMIRPDTFQNNSLLELIRSGSSL